MSLPQKSASTLRRLTEENESAVRERFVTVDSPGWQAMEPLLSRFFRRFYIPFVQYPG